MIRPAPARLVLGPLLRYVGDDEATVWVETDRACAVEVLGCSSPTFSVAGHRYGFVCVSGLESGACLAYEVHLDGDRCWPLADSPSRRASYARARPASRAVGVRVVPGHAAARAAVHAE